MKLFLLSLFLILISISCVHKPIYPDGTMITFGSNDDGIDMSEFMFKDNDPKMEIDQNIFWGDVTIIGLSIMSLIFSMLLIYSYGYKQGKESK